MGEPQDHFPSRMTEVAIAVMESGVDQTRCNATNHHEECEPEANRSVPSQSRSDSNLDDPLVTAQGFLVRRPTRPLSEGLAHAGIGRRRAIAPLAAHR